MHSAERQPIRSVLKLTSFADCKSAIRRSAAEPGGAATKLGRVRLLSNPDFFPESIPVQTRAQEERVGSTESHPPIKNVCDARAFSRILIDCKSALRCFQARSFFTTSPETSVRRKSRPWKWKVNFSWSMPRQ